MKKFIMAVVTLVTGLPSYGQKKTVSDTIPTTKEKIKISRLDFNVNLRTSHLWRGLVINDGMTATGYIHYTIGKKQNFTTGLWGGAGFDGKYTEINYFVQYQKNNFIIGLWDLFNTTGINSPRVFNYDKNTTTHLIDLRTSYRFPKTFPLRIEADILLYSGLNDRERNSSSYFRSRNSTYVELSYPLIRDQKTNLNIFMGAAFPINGSKHLYTTKAQSSFDIVNTGMTVSKNIEIFHYQLPVSATAMWNPSNKIARIQLDVKLF
ncbi:hypothetical protein H8R23_00865 [Flavobacterium sp. F-380]|uniref:DUF2490 domain containing protein n=1 Tax=Flavobacterium kayseriense TaxID=2764714 RepID=A0ABR7J301_9FLAO|nr:hypothetical protein [Flavobacterium kayseriense]MBC5839945.1 hypothetical protein [Flavobacterium kayseriense]MBC5847385.1 hypothetical protein [Flavobacterium kayseriense]